MRLGKILCVAICIIGLLGGCSVEDDMSNVYSELSTENLTMEITSVDDGYTESLTTSADKVALVDLTESEWEEITEMMRVYCTNVYVSTGKTTFGAGEHSFYVYVDKTPWIGGNQPRYFVQIERITNTENGQDCIEDLGYYIWVGADQSWHITPIGRFELGEKHFVGEGHFLIEDTDIFIFDIFFCEAALFLVIHATNRINQIFLTGKNTVREQRGQIGIKPSFSHISSIIVTIAEDWTL